MPRTETILSSTAGDTHLAECVRTVDLHSVRPPRHRKWKGADSNIEAELDDIPVMHQVVLALHAHLAGRLRGRHRPRRHQVVEVHDLGLDETPRSTSA